jgi:hypothetical protein
MAVFVDSREHGYLRFGLSLGGRTEAVNGCFALDEKKAKSSGLILTRILLTVLSFWVSG